MTKISRPLMSGGRKQGQLTFSMEKQVCTQIQATYSEQGSSSVRSARYTFAKWMNSIPMACLEVSKNLYRIGSALIITPTGG